MWSLADLLEKTDAKLVRGNRQQTISGVASLKEAKQGQLSFYLNDIYRTQLEHTQASVVLAAKQLGTDCHQCLPPDCALLLDDHAEESFIKVVHLFAPPMTPCSISISEQAYIHPQAQLGNNVRYGRVNIARSCIVGDGSQLADGVCLGEGVVLGKDCVLHANVVVYPSSVLGDRVFIHAGSVIGSDGFGYIPIQGSHRKIPHLGKVVIEDDVEIGANCSIDRGSLGITRIGEGSKLDNLVHIGHNVDIGNNSIICGQVGIAGSTEIGEGSMLGGQVAVSDHVRVGKYNRIHGASTVWQDTQDKADLLGNPARDRMKSLREMASVARLPGLMKRLTKLLKE